MPSEEDPSSTGAGGRILVTGGAGYVGSHVIERLAAAGRTISVLDSLHHGHPAAVRGAELHIGDIRDRRAIERALGEDRVEGIVHLAALKSVDESMQNPAEYFDANAVGTLRLVEAAASAGIRWFVYSSTCAVYGTPSELPVTEGADIRPENPYGESKLMGERLVTWLGRRHGFTTVVLRYFNAAGATPEGDLGEDPRDAPNLIPAAMLAALGLRPPLRLFGSDYPTPDGTAIRDYIHVADLADAHLRAIAYLEDGGESTTLNLGTGRGASVLEVIGAIEAISGRRVPVEHVGRRPGDPAAVWADPRRAHAALGWASRRDLDEIVRSAWLWHSRHPRGFATETGGA